jgi:predicted metalloprotease
MRLDDEQESGNYEIQRGGGGGMGFGGGGGGLGMIFGLVGSRFGCGGIVVLIVIMMVLGMNPLSMLGGGSGVAPTTQTATPGDASQLTGVQRLSLKVLGSTERRWGEIYAARGEQYTPTTLVFYDRNGQSGCGAAQSAMGPFYCPVDNRVYLDTSFFDELKSRFGAPGDFAQAYVIAHEVGHHIQTLDGTAAKVRAEQQRASEAASNALQVKMELQADCYAGVWAARDTNLLEPGDVEEGLRAAQAIGDDTLQREAQGRVVPESFTHGTSAQRQMWLKRGLDSGDPAKCDTFAG